MKTLNTILMFSVLNGLVISMSHAAETENQNTASEITFPELEKVI